MLHHLRCYHAPPTFGKLVHNATPARCRPAVVHALQATALSCREQLKRGAGAACPTGVTEALPAAAAEAIQAAVRVVPAGGDGGLSSSVEQQKRRHQSPSGCWHHVRDRNPTSTLKLAPPAHSHTYTPARTEWLVQAAAHGRARGCHAFVRALDPWNNCTNLAPDPSTMARATHNVHIVHVRAMSLISTNGARDAWRSAELAHCARCTSTLAALASLAGGWPSQTLRRAWRRPRARLLSPATGVRSATRTWRAS